jgi:hypothetical protein
VREEGAPLHTPLAVAGADPILVDAEPVDEDRRLLVHERMGCLGDC